MARIEYSINRNATGDVTIVSTITRIDPGDEIVLTTETPNTAVQWTGDSPFAPPAAGTIYVLPTATSPQMPLEVVKSTNMSQAVAKCGEADGAGNFAAWTQGAGFPGTGPIHRQVGDAP